MNPPQNNNLDPNLFSGPFAAFGQTINGLKDKISQIQAQRVLNKNTIKDKLAELGRNIEEIVQQTTNKLRPLAARNAELTQQVQQQQYNSMLLLRDYLTDIMETDKLVDEQLRTAKHEQKDIVGEIDKLKQELDELIR